MISEHSVHTGHNTMQVGAKHLTSYFFLLIMAADFSFADKISSPVTFSEVMELHATLHRSAQGVTSSYGPDHNQSILRLDGPRKSGVLMLIHGGCWSNAYGRDHILPMAATLSTLGHDVWVPEYRRIGDDGGGWPGSVGDIIEATRFVVTNTGRQPILIGHSAGGHLALRAAQTGLSIKGVIGLAPITDLISYGGQPGSCQTMVAPFMGDKDFSPNPAYREASVNQNDINVPVFIVIGGKDAIVGKDQIDSFSSEHVAVVADAGHFDVIHPHTEAFTAVLRALAIVQKAGP